MNRKERRAAKKRAPGGAASIASPASAALFDQAIRHHQAGHLAAAEAICRDILAREPKHIGGLHLLGVIAHQNERFEEAVAQFRKVIVLRPDVAPAHQGLGGALAASGRLEEAASAFERALTLKANSPAGLAPEDVQGFLSLGNLYADLRRWPDAVRCYERALSLQPDHAEAHNSLGAVLVAQGNRREAAARFARALVLAPELFESFANISSTLRRVNPVLDDAIRRTTAAWPRRLPAGELFPSDALAAVADDPVLRCMLESSTARDLELEKFLTNVRAAVLGWAENPSAEMDAAVLGFCCALARQCFINEYVFLDTPEEVEQADTLRRALSDALAAGDSVPPLWLAAVACYAPLGSLPDPQVVLGRTWPEPVAELLDQQVREVAEEQRARDSISRLTAIAEGASVQVRRQYEENPYPRWILAPSRRAAMSIDDYLRGQFAGAPFRPLGDRAALDILIAGCGTGEHPIGMARRFRGARVLAVDLSLSSLGYAARKTRQLGVQNIEYAQADILRLDSLGRSFDVIDASGVLHHLAEPDAGWRALLALLRPSGLMRIGLYSEHARADVVAVRRFIAERGLQPTPADIRRCRHELLATPLGSVSRYRDFYSTSECRDLLFHVQERRFTIPQIKESLSAHNLRFVGFELHAAALQAYRNANPQDESMTDLDRWNAFEIEQPATFSAMYQLWCQLG